MTHIYALVNQKGGVGKTTTTINLGAYLAQLNRKVLLVDLDPQANDISCWGIDKQKVKSSVYDVLIEDVTPADTILVSAKLNLSLVPASPELAGAEVELVNELAREQRLKTRLAT